MFEPLSLCLNSNFFYLKQSKKMNESALSEIVPDYEPLSTDNFKDKTNDKDFSFENIRLDNTENIDDLWDDNKSYADNLKEIISYSFVIPDAAIQLPIFLAYASLPSALCSVIPILFLQGQEGSGKSLATILLSGVFKQEILSSATTFAAIRNTTQKARWQSPEAQNGEQNYAVLFDNVNAQTLLNENMYTYFLNGYNRRTDSIQISKGDGTNMVFKVFGAKVCSSIHPIYANPRMAEISRRMLVLKFQRLERMSENDIGDFDVNSRLEIESMDLSILNLKFWQLWGYGNSNLFGEYKRELTARKKSFKVPKSIKSTQWALCPDLIAAGIVSGVWKDIAEAISAMAAYWDWYAENIASTVSSLQKACAAYVHDEITKTKGLIDKHGLDLPLEIKCDGLKVHLDNLGRQGALECYPTPQYVTTVMAAMGWKREIGVNGEWVWMSAN